jgi:dipeptidyl-peptidase-4
MFSWRLFTVGKATMSNMVSRNRLHVLCSCVLAGSLILLPGHLVAQSALGPEPVLTDLPGYANSTKIRNARRELSGGGRVTGVTWSADGKSVAFKKEGEKLQLDLSSYQIGPAVDTPAYQAPEAERSPRRGGVGRALQRSVEVSPDEKWKAICRNNNVVVEANGENQAEPIQVTTDGNDRLRYGTGCWVYGEELFQDEAMWWSPDSRLLVFYEMDEQHMKDYYLTLNNTSAYTKIQDVRYPKAGDDNPKVALLVFDLESRQTKRLEIEGEPMQYLFNIRFTPAGDELLVSRTNRLQNKLDVLAVNPRTGSVRTVVSETQETWQENKPLMQFLEDNQRFVWETEKNGYKHYELRHLNGQLINPLSKAENYPCTGIVQVDEKSGWFYYTAFSAENPYNVQLHRVKLDGSQHKRLTSSPLSHSGFEIAPDHTHVIAVRQQLDVPPSTVVYNTNGEEVAVLNTGDTTGAEEFGLSPPELFSFTSTDGTTEIFGTLHKPAHFDPDKKYPLVIDVYGGPQSSAFRNTYQAANPMCELGFVIAKIGNRGTQDRGKAFESANYRNLGGIDMQDQADGVRYLAQRPYIDGNRVGIYGHSYGGYMSALGILKYPDVFQVAVAGAPVTDWKNYDTIYTERYMQTPKENPSGYNDGSCMTFAKNLRGHLLLVHGLIDDNVHPANTWQLVKALQDADKRFDMMIYPGFKHGIGSTYQSLIWEYLVKHLQPEVPPEQGT